MAVTISSMYENLEKYEKDNYYIRDAEPEKIGKGWEKLGDAEINNETYKKLADGKDLQGNRLVDNRNGHRPGYNITFSPDKSFSVAAFASEDMRQDLMECHREAVKETMKFLEEELAQARTRENGERTIEKTGNIVGFLSEHQVNRDGDVQIHTHAVVFNMTHNEKSGQWQAMHSDAFKSNILEKVYENELAQRLQEKGYAVEWKASESGRSQYACVGGVPEKAIEATSKRAEAIREALEGLRSEYNNASRGELKQIAAYQTRSEKKEMTMEEMRKQFEERLSEAGVTKADIINGINQARESEKTMADEKVKMNAYEIVRQAYSVLSENKAVFSKQDLVKASMDISRGDVSIREVQKAINDFAENKSIEKLSSSTKIQDHQRTYADDLFTTRENLKAEKEIFRMAESRIGKEKQILSTEKAKDVIAQYEKDHQINMTESQRGALREILCSRDGVTLVQGHAGTGKTTFLQALREIAEKNGYRIQGMSETNAAVNQMKEVGIDAQTVTKWLQNKSQSHADGPKTFLIGENTKLGKTELQDISRGKETTILQNEGMAIGANNETNKGTILVVDESSFLGSRNMRDILKNAEKTGTKVIFLGDKNQLPAVSAGFPFRDLQERGKVKTVEMKDIVRQTDQNLRIAVKSITEKDIEKAFQKIDIREVQGSNIYKETARIYMEQNGYRNTIVNTYTNKDKDVLNQEIRNLLKAKNVISKDEKNIAVYVPKNLHGSEKMGIQNYGVGDKLVVAKSGSGSKVGAELVVTEVNKQKGTITVIKKTKQGIKKQEIDVRKHGDKFNTYQRETKSFSQGDKIIFTANSQEKKIANNETGYIKEIKGDQIKVQVGKREVEFDAKKFSHFEHGYASTTHKSQGKTANKTIYFARTEGMKTEGRFQDFYVGVSRGKEGAVVITDNKEKLQEEVGKMQKKDTVASLEKEGKIDRSVEHGAQNYGRAR